MILELPRLTFFSIHFRATKQAAKWNDAAVVVGCLCTVPLVLRVAYEEPIFKGILGVMSITWAWCMAKAYFYSKQPNEC